MRSCVSAGMVPRRSRQRQALLIHEIVAAQAAARGGETAVRCGADQLTYGELEERSNALARYLQGLGVGPESLVGLYLERGCRTVISILAVLKAGGAYVPMDLA